MLSEFEVVYEQSFMSRNVSLGFCILCVEFDRCRSRCDT